MKNKFKKQDYINILILCLMYAFIIILITHGKFMYGSKTDWDIQHWAFPEYFRNLFYETKNLIPNFATNIGGGQNIFYFAYYGLLSPITLLSYLFPKVAMYDYITITSILVVIVSVILFYKWLKNKGYSSIVCFCSSALFLCAGPLIFHSHRHIMFINYMPFLILALISTDKYFEKGVKSPIIISTFLIIMTSYFYSITSILCIIIYGVYVFSKKYDKVTFKLFLKEGLKFISLILIAILMSAILILPTFYCLLNGRSHGTSGINIGKLLLPNFGLENVLYQPYSVGLTSILIIALFSLVLLKKEKHVKFLTISLIIPIFFNVFIYVLNGGLYLNGKALIPLLPLYTFVITIFLDKVLKKEISFQSVKLSFLITVFLSFTLSKIWIALIYTICSLIVIIILRYYFKKENKKILLIPIVTIAFVICIAVNFTDKLITKKDHKIANNNHIQKLVDYASKDKTFYRTHIDVKNPNINRILNKKQNGITLYSSTYNKNYNKFFYKTFNNNMKFRNSAITFEDKNILFETFMGVKYLITDKEPPLGYEKIKTESKYTLYENKNYLPIMYASSDVISKKDYDKFLFPYNIEALTNNIIVSENVHNSQNTNVSKVNVKDISNIKNIQINKNDFYVSKDIGKLRLNLNEEIHNKILLVRLNVSEPQSCIMGDISITINGIKNKLTCKEWKYFNENYTFDYMVSNKAPFNYINLTFTKGHYKIKNIEMYAINYENVSNLKQKINEFKVDKTLNDKVSGYVNVTRDSYFIIKVPYDKGFNIKLDNKTIKYKKVSDAFIGFKIKKGLHNIEVSYDAPYLKEGKIISLAGLILALMVLLTDLINNKISKRK